LVVYEITMQWLDSAPLRVLLVLVVFPGMASPCLAGKIRMPPSGLRVGSIGIFDFVLHGPGIVLVGLKIARIIQLHGKPEDG